MIYAFRCKCNHRFDKQLMVAEFQAFKDKKLKVVCPKCASVETVNIICPIPAHYRGDGWTKQAINDVTKQNTKEPINVTRDKSS